MPKILGGEARGRKIVRMATKWDSRIGFGSKSSKHSGGLSVIS
jgi:hypothetical protein